MKNFQKIGSTYILVLGLLSIGFLTMQACKSDDGNPNGPTTKGPVVTIASDILLFGQIPEGQHATRDFLIFNTGDQNLDISSLKITGVDAASFSIVGDTAGITIPANKIETFRVNYSPGRTGDFEAQVSIESNATSSPDSKLLAGKATSAAGNITFERIIGDVDNDTGGHVRVLNDGGFIITGSSYEPIDEENLATLTRFDRFGNIMWSKQYPVTGISSFSGLVVTANENFVLTGSTRTNVQSNPNIFALSTDISGNIIWENVYNVGGSQQDDGNDIIKTTGGGYMITGATKNTDDPVVSGVKDALLLKIDNSGAVEWYKKYGTSEGEELNSVQQTKSGEYICVGSTTVPSTSPNGDFDFYLLKTDRDGNQIWSKTFGGELYDFGTSLIIDDQGDYVFTGYTSNYGAGLRDWWLIKTDTSGTEEWNNTFGGAENDSPSEIIQTSDKGYFIVGVSASFSTNDQGQPSGKVWVVKTDNSGTMAWNEIYGGDDGKGGSSGSSVREITTGSGGFIICGTTSDFSIDNNIYLLKTNSDGSF